MKQVGMMWLRNNWSELLAFMVNVAIAYITIQLQNLLFFAAAVLIFTGSLILVIYQKTRERDFYFLPMTKRDDGKDWVGRGNFAFIPSESCFEITQAESGFIFPKTIIWDDYSFEFNFKVAKHKMGWIVRARDLSSYIMLQCTPEGINPHVRIDGEWMWWTHDKAQPNLTFAAKLSLDKWYTAKLLCEKQRIRIIVCDQKQTIFDRNWEIPEHIPMTYDVREGDTTTKLTIKRRIDLYFGAIGFRNWGDERGFVKNVYVQKL